MFVYQNTNYPNKFSSKDTNHFKMFTFNNTKVLIKVQTKKGHTLINNCCTHKSHLQFLESFVFYMRCISKSFTSVSYQMGGSIFLKKYIRFIYT